MDSSCATLCVVPVLLLLCVYICVRVCIHTYTYFNTGWRRLIGSPKLQIIFHKRATKYRSLLRKITYKDKGSYESSPPCMCDEIINTCINTYMGSSCAKLCVVPVLWPLGVYMCVCVHIYIYVSKSMQWGLTYRYEFQLCNTMCCACAAAPWRMHMCVCIHIHIRI